MKLRASSARQVGGLTALAFLVRSLFAAGEQGVWYDPSDLSSMYQDSAATTPAVVGQPVGFIGDKRFGMARGPEIWVDGSVTFSGGSSRVGANTYRVFSADGTLSEVKVLSSGIAIGEWVEVTFTIDSITTLGGGVRVGATSGPAFTTTGTKRCIIAYDSVDLLLKRASGITDIQISNVSFKRLPGNHATQATGAARPTLQQEANGKYYLSFDGTDDFLATGSVSFAASDKMTVLVGLRKNSDAARGVVIELGNATTNSFRLDAPLSAAPNYLWASTGTLSASNTLTTYTAPVTNVITGVGDISGDLCQSRVNGGAYATSTVDQGTGNYRADVLYIGRRGGASLPFNGRLYGLIVRGAASTAPQISNAERHLARKAGITF